MSESNRANGDGAGRVSAAGAYSLAEILSQPQCWAECLNALEHDATVRQIGERFANAPEWIFIGCGSSYYIALAAAASWSAITGTRARAVPASELLLFPDLVFAGTSEFAPVLISRSGETTEVLRTADLLQVKGIPSIAISCATKQRLRQRATISILLSPADEQSTVMTRSFSSMLIALQFLAASMAGNSGFLQALHKLPSTADDLVTNLPARIREFANQNLFADYVCLGQGPFYGLACESALKLTEMSCSYAQSFHTLEFRHGPKSIVSDDTLITFLLSEANEAAETDVLEEVKALGGTTLVVAREISARARAAADFVVEIPADLPEYARLAAFVVPAQLMGVYVALRKRLDPDHPRHLSRVVVLGEESKPAEKARS